MLSESSPNTRLAVAVWQGRVSPVFDCSRRLLLVEVDQGRVCGLREESLDEPEAAGRVARLRALGVETLVCGAVSRPLADALTQAGVRLFPFVAGEIHAVVEACLKGRLPSPEFGMPGCRCHRRRMRHGGAGGCGGQRRLSEDKSK